MDRPSIQEVIKSWSVKQRVQLYFDHHAAKEMGNKVFMTPEEEGFLIKSFNRTDEEVEYYSKMRGIYHKIQNALSSVQRILSQFETSSMLLESFVGLLKQNLEIENIVHDMLGVIEDESAKTLALFSAVARIKKNENREVEVKDGCCLRVRLTNELLRQFEPMKELVFSSRTSTLTSFQALKEFVDQVDVKWISIDVALAQVQSDIAKTNMGLFKLSAAFRRHVTKEDQVLQFIQDMEKRLTEDPFDPEFYEYLKNAFFNEKV